MYTQTRDKMTIISERADRRQALLNGIKQNHNYTQIAAQLGVKRRDITLDVKAMYLSRDRDFRDAKRIGKANAIEEKKSISIRRDKKFHDMTGMTFQEQSFQNMVNFYKPELMKILKSRDQEKAIRNLSKSTRRTLIKNGILKRSRKIAIVQQARDQLQ